MNKILMVALAASFVTGLAYGDEPTISLDALKPAAKPAGDSITTSAASETPISTVGNVNQTTVGQPLMKTLHDKVEFSYFGIYRGAAINDPGNGLQPLTDGNPDITSPQGVESFVTTGYKFAPDWMAGVSTHFFYNGEASTGPANQPLGTGFEMLNPSLVISKANLIDTGQLKVKGYMYAMLPLTKYDVISEPGNNMITTLQPTANMTYDIKDTRWTLGLYSYFAGYISGPNTPDNGHRVYKLYSAPYINYQATPTVAATLWVDLIQITRAQGTGFIDGASNPTTDIEPGVSWDIIPGRLTVNPVLNIYPSSASISSTSVQMIIIGKAF